MKILHVLRSPVGGLFRHVVDVANGQIARGHEVGIVADSGSGNALSKAALAVLEPKLALGLSRIPIRRNPHPADLSAIWHVARRIATSSADVVHGHGAKGGALARLAPAGRRIVRAYTPHGGSLHDEVGGALHILLERMLKPMGQLYLFESSYSQGVYRRKVGEPTGIMRVVHNGVRGDEFEPIELSDDASDIIYLGELRALKGVDVLIDAIDRLRAGGRRITARLAGEGAERALLQSKIDNLGLGDQVKLCGTLPTRQALALGRIVVLPSRAESLPYVVLEAAAAGKPLVATEVGGIPEIFGSQAGRLVASGDVEALMRAVAFSVDHPRDALDQARLLRERIATEFSVDVMVDAILGAYQQARAIGSAPPSAALLTRNRTS